MGLLGGLLDRIVLVVGVIAGGTVPSFLAQHRQRVGGALDQAQADLAPFQQIANQLHEGSIDKLIWHHMGSTDATFRAEGAALQSMVDAVNRLRSTLAGLDTDVFHQLFFVVTRGDHKLLRATWDAFQPGFGFSADSLLMAAAIGVSIWLAFVAVWWTGAALLGFIASRRKPVMKRPIRRAET